MSSAQHADPFDSASHADSATRMGGFLVVAAELVLLGGLLAVYAATRSLGSDAWPAASKHLDLALGGVGTVILLASSFTAAMAAWAARTNEGGQRKGQLTMFLGATAGLSLLFAVLKYVEYSALASKGLLPGSAYAFAGIAGDAPQRFFAVYFLFGEVLMLHAIIGAIIMGRLLMKAGSYDAASSAKVENGALFCHAVTIMGCFALPLLYLVR